MDQSLVTQVHHHWVWLSYALAAFLTLVCKLVKYVYWAKRGGKSGRQAIMEWFFDPTAENAVSWIATVGVVWAFGFLFIEASGSFTGIFGTVFQYLPVACPIAFFLGYGMEMKAPDIAKWMLDKVLNPKI